MAHGKSQNMRPLLPMWVNALRHGSVEFICRKMSIAAHVILVIGLLANLTACSSAAIAGDIRIMDVSVSSSKVRDGQIITLGYYIYSRTQTVVSLGCTLHGAGPDIIEDDTHEGPAYDITLKPGAYWYYRKFFVNVPPGVRTGSYGVEWGISWGSNFTSITKWGKLSLISPISVRVPILMYHKIGPVAYSEYWVTTDNFVKQLQALKAYGYTPVSLYDVMDCRAGLRSLPPKPVVITFDDGYDCVAKIACPAMESVGFKGVTQFIPTGRVGGDNSWDPGDDNPIIPEMTWDTILSLDGTGWVDMEARTVTHPELPMLSSSALNYELDTCADTLQDKLGHRPRFIAWPFGMTSNTVNKAARNADYFAGLVSYGGVEHTCANKWMLNRVEINWNTSTDYDKNNPQEYFFNLLEEPTPLMQVNSISAQTSSKSNVNLNASMNSGTDVVISVVAKNSGQQGKIRASLLIGTPSESGMTIVLNTRDIGQDVSGLCDKGMVQLGWGWQVPTQAKPGTYYARVVFNDEFGVLGLGGSGDDWVPIFTVGGTR